MISRARRRPAAVVAILLVVAAVLAGLFVSGRPGGGPAPTAAPSVPPSAPPVADRPPLTVDGHIRDADLQHDSRDDLYRTPGGAVPAGTAVILRLRAAAGDLSGADVRLADRLAGTSVVAPMALVATDPTAGEHGYAYWEATVRTLATPTVLDYTIVAHDGSATRYLSDDPVADGGTGGIYREPPKEGGWQITAYDPDFTTPAWTRGAVVYQIFPDRFSNGDPGSDPSPAATPGTEGAARFRYGDVYGNPVLAKRWDERPEGYCRAYQGVSCAEGPLGRDFYGGDLAGITARLGELADLGVTVLYLNPIFAAPSNHRYDTSDYLTVDPDLGTNADFDVLIATAGAHGIRVILDGVFNHVSSDSPWFDRAGRFSEVGACESPDSPYRSWFTFRAPGPNEPSPCAPSKPGGSDTYYVGWFGFDTIPEMQEVPAVLDLVTGPDGVVPYWLRRGIAGWRLDVVDSLSHDFLQRIRSAAKAADPDALVLGEQWGDTSPWLLGSEVDSTMNYRFRRAVIALVNGDTPDLDGSLEALTPSRFAAAMRAVQEDYPRPAFDALLNLVDGHDTTRILWTLTPADENDAAKADPAALAEGKAKLRLVAAIQLTWSGMASIYYGDEVGLGGQDDPDDRRPYPWGGEDNDLRAYYRTLARLRADHVALREGDLRFLLADDDTDIVSFLRRTDADAVVTVLNLAGKERVVTADVSGQLPDGARLTDALGGPGATVSGGRLEVPVAARSAAVLVVEAGTDLAPPPAPDGLQATAAAARVDLRWSPVDGAAGYRVWRSLVRAGGYTALADVAEPAFTDATARAGTRYHYVVTALDATGNVSQRSLEVDALPELYVADALLEGPAAMETPLSATGEGASVAGRVAVDGVTAAAGMAIGLRVQFGLGPEGSDPARDAGWRWTEATFTGDVEGADRYAAHLQPDAAGTFAVAMRVSTSGGESWTYGDLDGSANGFQVAQAVRLTALPGSDADPPPAPGAPTVTDTAEDHVTLAWAPVAAADLYRYEVMRAEAPGGPYAALRTTTAPTFTDGTVAAGGQYAYVVVAVDTSFNRSARSPELVVAATKREVQVTFSVTLPDTTPPGDTIFLAGDFQGWNPGGTPMTRATDGTWAITVTFPDGATPQYKYTRGSWDAVEKDSGCGEIPNRTFTVTYGSDGTQRLDDVVGKWRDIDHCG